MQVKILRLYNTSILEQLQLEEALLRVDTSNWCIINQGSPPAIVMGISGKPEQLINQELIQEKPIPLIKRFTGGGTVVIDENTLFISFIFSSELVKVPCQQDKILKWTQPLYQQTFGDINFKVIENDYALGNKKVGGNAQYFRKNRWLHHTSFLWDYAEENMNYLLMPPKTPKYRDNRNHSDFLSRLKGYHPDKEQLLLKFEDVLKKQFQLIEVSTSDVAPILNHPHRKATEVVKYNYH